VKVGDLVKCTGVDMVTRIGIIIRIGEPRYEGPFGMDEYEVITESGKIKIYTDAGVKPL
jgi:hypothetical protein